MSQKHKKPISEVDEETLYRIGAAYLICSQYPEIFGNVKVGKFRAMFLDDYDCEELDDE